MKKRTKQIASVYAQKVPSNLKFVLAAKSNEIEPTMEMAHYKCNHCRSEFAGIKDFEPFCVVCSSADVVEQPTTEDDVKLEDLQTSSCDLICKCGTHNIVSEVTASALQGTAHCVSCGSAMHYASTEDSDDDESLDDIGDVTESDSLDEDDTRYLGGDDVDFDPDASEEDAGDDEAGDDDLSLEDDESEDDESETAGDDESDEEEVEELDDDTAEEAKAYQFTGSKDVSFAVASDRLYMFAKGHPVAVLSKKAAGENGDLINNQEFANAIALEVETAGVSSAIKKFNFKPYKFKVEQADVVKEKVDKQVAQMQAKFAKREKALFNKFMEAASVAAAGINKNFFRDVENASALRNSLVSEFEQLGVQEAGVIVDHVLASKIDDHVRSILVKAQDIYSKPAEVQTELASAITNSNYATVEKAAFAVKPPKAVQRTVEESSAGNESGDIKSRFGFAPGQKLFS